MSPCASSSRTTSCSRGFTLVELLLVVTILSAVAWMSTSVLMDNTDQLRFDDTRNRLQAIRRAILGDSSRTLNGSPVISGYVADMGGPPVSLAALLNKDYCSGADAIDAGTCASSGGTWISPPARTYDATHDLWYGWTGPYLTAAELLGYPKFQDGWGNDDGLVNFGWRYTLDDPNPGDLTLKSLGRDGASGGAGDYDSDFPPATSQPYVLSNEYRLTVTTEGTAAADDGQGGLWVDFGTTGQCWKCNGVLPSNTSVTSRTTCLDVTGASWAYGYMQDQAACQTLDNSTTGLEVKTIWLPDYPSTEPTCIAVAISGASGITELHSKAASFTWNGSRQVLQFKFADGTTLNQGQASFRVFKYDSTATPACTSTSFPAGASAWRVFSVLPGAAMQPLTWEVR